jgi:predicted amidohydrolase YtcJ
MLHATIRRAGRVSLALAVLAITPLAAQPPGTAVPSGADLILENGAFFTPNGWADALAIRDGVIIAVGRAADVARHRAGTTSTVDLDGAAVFPGLHDLHVHPVGAGLAQLQCQFPQGSTRERIVAAVRDCAERSAEGEWIIGGQWDAASFGPEPMDRRVLDEAAPRNPVALTDISYHSLWANTLALELAGITASTPDPPGGIIERDADGRATGILRESAGGLVRRLAPPPTPEQRVQAVRWSLDLMLSYGITAFTDALADASSLRVYAELADRGELKQRATVCLAWRGAALGNADAGLPDHVAYRNLYARDRIAPDCIKLSLDGVPTDAHTAAMVEPYEGAGDNRGLLMIPPETLNALVTELDARGFRVKMHAAGDLAVSAGLDAIEAARRANGFNGPLHELAHNSFVQMSDIRRARQLGATFEMSPYIWFPNPIIPDVASAVGAERMERMNPIRDALDAGALVVPGSDWSVVPSVNPWIAIETLVTRQAPGGGGAALGASQKITLAEAIDLFTVNAATHLGRRNRTGTIERGMLADLVVVDRNPFEVPITEVHRTGVLMTLIEGEIVYRSDAARW